MIIHIENIPTNQKIKSINFSIDFESGESETIIKTPIDNQSTIQTIKPHNIHETAIEPIQFSSINTEKRELKEIPAEMLNLEF